MGRGGKQTMVCRKKGLTIWLLLTCHFTYASALPYQNQGFLFLWKGDKPQACHQLVEIFLTELRSIATAHTIEFEAIDKDSNKGSNLKKIAIYCKKDVQVLEIKDEEGPITMHFLPQARSFDSIDWLSFQKKYLSVTNVQSENSVISASNINEKTLLKDSKTQPWWFWTSVGVVLGVSAYFLAQSSGHLSSGIKVELK